MKYVYLIRHGLPDFPEGKRMCLGSTDIPLGEEGLAQARKMAQRLPPVTAVFASPLRRVIQTAEAVGLPVQVIDGLRELHAGDWDGLSFDEIRSRYADLYAARDKDKTLPLPGAEDKRAGLSRFQKAMLQAAGTAQGDFAVVSHGGIIELFLQDIAGTWHKPAYTEIIPLCFEKGQFFIPEEK